MLVALVAAGLAVGVGVAPGSAATVQSADSPNFQLYDGPIAGSVDTGTLPATVRAEASPAVNATESGLLESAASVAVTRSSAGALRYEVSVSATQLSGTDRLWAVVVGAGTVVEAEGFERTAGDGPTRLRWTGDESARVVVEMPTSDRWRGGEAWTFGRVPFVELQRAVDGSIERSWPLADRSGRSGEAGVVGGRYALVGAGEVETRERPNGRLHLVVPAGVTLASGTDAVADSLAAASHQLDVDDSDAAVLAYAVPDSEDRYGESVPAHDEFWVRADRRLDSPENVWLHEYVHTRQSFALAPEMRWFREASAEYYAATLSHEQGLIGEREMRTHLRGEPSTATLTRPETWTGSQTPDDKGARALAALDRRIAEASYGYRSLEDVFARLNSHDGPVTYAVFAQAVAEVAGHPMDAWLDRHVAGSAPVGDPYGSDPLAAGDSLVETTGLRGTGGAFFVTAVGLSVVAAAPLYGILSRRQRDSGERRPPTGRAPRRKAGP